MAKPIPLQLPKRDPQEQLRSRLEKAPDEHVEALLAGLDGLQSLHDQGVLELLRGVLGGGNKILEIVVDASKSPEAIRGIRVTAPGDGRTAPGQYPVPHGPDARLLPDEAPGGTAGPAGADG